MRLYLDLRTRVSRGPVLIDSGFVLRYHGDNDRQELAYAMSGREWWKKEMRLFSPYLSKGGAAIDVGANMGFLTTLFSQLVGQDGHVYSFEPSPTTHVKLLETLEANKLTNVSTFNMGCGRVAGELVLYASNHSGHSTFRPEGDTEVAPSGTVPIVALDEFMEPKLDRLDLLKIDTEGFEDEVLAGAMGLIRKFRPTICVELTLQRATCTENVIKALTDEGYRFDRPVKDLDELGENYFAFPSSTPA